METLMKCYPLVFSFPDTVAGDGYIARVTMHGRALLVEEDDGDVWMFGVQPGGIAGGDHVREVAFAEFQQSYRTVLFDIAAEVRSFEEFKTAVEEFFGTINEPDLKNWEHARQEVRNARTSLPGLPTQTDHATPSLAIEKLALENIKPTANQFPSISKAA
jgi:hypothetical protein